MNDDIEPKGDCPFCDAPKWHICSHFTGYVQGGVVMEGGRDRRAHLKRDDEIAVNTGVSIRAYRRTP